MTHRFAPHGARLFAPEGRPNVATGGATRFASRNPWKLAP